MKAQRHLNLSEISHREKAFSKWFCYQHDLTCHLKLQDCVYKQSSPKSLWMTLGNLQNPYSKLKSSTDLIICCMWHMWSVPNPLGLMHEGQIYLYFINFFSCTHFCHGCFICDSKKYYCLKISIPSSENVFFSFISVRLELFFFRSIFFFIFTWKRKKQSL